MLTTLLDVVLFLTSIFLILLVLVQRGKGGGLAGALGGVGGYSAFGTRAGDMFTKITIGVASFWLALAVLTVLVHKSGGSLYAGRKAPPPAAQDQPMGGGPAGAATERGLPLGSESGSDLPLLGQDPSLLPGQDAAPDAQPQSTPEQEAETNADSEP